MSRFQACRPKLSARLQLLATAISSTFALAAAADHPLPEQEELLVTATRDSRQIDVAQTIAISPDAAALLKNAPGANVNGNGPLTGIAQYRGMYGARVNVSVNGNSLSAGGPNWMDPPLSYAPAAQLESLQVYRGIAPVSAGQETIGGAIDAKTWSGEFGDSSEFASSGRVRAGYQTVNEGWLTSATVIAANSNHRFKVAGHHERADDAEFDGGEILPSEYQRQRFDLGYGYQRGKHSLQLDVGRNETEDTGTAALPMDIDYIDTDLGSLKYGYDFGNWSLQTDLYYSDIEHGMTNYKMRQAPANPAMYRRNTATGDNLGFGLEAVREDVDGLWRFGIDSHYEEHNSNIDNPNNPMFFVTAFNDAERRVTGLYLERNMQLDSAWLLELGLRYNRVEMDADVVDGTPAQMSMMMGGGMGAMMGGMMMSPGATLRDDFNSAKRDQNDDNFDAVAKLYYQANSELSYYLGLAQKTRSASYQERYLWLPLEATGGLADGRTYTGNIELDAEIAHEIELGFDYSGDALTLSPRLFYRDVGDYIQGTESNSSAAVSFVAMMNGMNGTANPPPLQFNNVDAEIYGFDMDWQYRLDSHWSLSGIVNYVRGKRDDVDDNLYRIAPLNTTLAMNYQSTSWGATLESQLYDKQDKVSDTNSEQETAGYGLVNARGYWQLSGETRLGFGIDNVLDKSYRDHLTGYNRVMGNPDIAKGDRLYGYGRNFYARVDYHW